MRELLLVVLTAFITTITTMYGKALVMRIRRLLSRFKARKYQWGKHKLSKQHIFEQIEKRIDLLNQQNASFHDRIDNIEDDLEWQAELLTKRDKGRKEMVRREVRTYLEELKNG